MSNPIAIVCIQYTKTTNNEKKKSLYWTNKLQGQSPHTSVPKNWKDIIEIKQDKKKRW